MIQLNTDFTLLNKYFGISPSKIYKYANKDFEEIMKAEAEEGNVKAANYKEILSDPDKILEIFKLVNPENKLMILQSMSEHDLDDLLPFLTNKELALGLQFFTDEKLMTMCTNLPIEEIIGMVFENFCLNDVLKIMSEDAMDKFIYEPDVERNYTQKYFEGLEKNSLEKIMVKSFGEEYTGKTKKEYLDGINELSDGDYKRFLTTLERKDKMEMICTTVEQDDRLLTLFDANDLLAPMNLLMKDEKIKMIENINKEFLTPMIQELPADLTQIVLTQIDSNEFAKVIAKDFQNILGEVVLFSTRG